MYQQQCENTQHSEGKTSPVFCFLVIARQRDHRRLGINGSVPRPYNWHFSTSREYFALPRLDLPAFSLPFSSNYETQNFSPKVQLVVNIFQSLSPARIQFTSKAETWGGLTTGVDSSMRQSVMSSYLHLSFMKRCSLEMRCTQARSCYRCRDEHTAKIQSSKMHSVSL